MAPIACRVAKVPDISNGPIRLQITAFGHFECSSIVSLKGPLVRPKFPLSGIPTKLLPEARQRELKIAIAYRHGPGRRCPWRSGHAPGVLHAKFREHLRIGVRVNLQTQRFRAARPGEDSQSVERHVDHRRVDRTKPFGDRGNQTQHLRFARDVAREGQRGPAGISDPLRDLVGLPVPMQAVHGHGEAVPGQPPGDGAAQAAGAAGDERNVLRSPRHGRDASIAGRAASAR